MAKKKTKQPRSVATDSKIEGERNFLQNPLTESEKLVAMQELFPKEMTCLIKYNYDFSDMTTIIINIFYRDQLESTRILYSYFQNEKLKKRIKEATKRAEFLSDLNIDDGFIRNAKPVYDFRGQDKMNYDKINNHRFLSGKPKMDPKKKKKVSDKHSPPKQSIKTPPEASKAIPLDLFRKVYRVYKQFESQKQKNAFINSILTMRTTSDVRDMLKTYTTS